jgi:hypothetical protein
MWVQFEGQWNGNCWHILWPFGIIWFNWWKCFPRFVILYQEKYSNSD